MADPLLRVKDLRTEFMTRDGVASAVDGLSFEVSAGQTLAIVGESGCGKSVTALSLMRLVPSPPGRIAGGRVLLAGQDLLALSEAQMRTIRGNRIAMVFQEPMTSLNPVLTIGRQIEEIVMLHQGLSHRAARARAIELLRLVQIAEPEQRVDAYPHLLSGGMRQRVMIAMALACDPQVLVADEPTTALDVTIQAQILDLLQDLQARTGAAVVLITHDLGVVAEVADRVVVMYAGRKAEEASVQALFDTPLHPYMRGLMASIPRMDAPLRSREELAEIPGTVPPLHLMPPGCRFAPRCGRADPHCSAEAPPLVALAPDHLVACWHPGHD